MSCVNVDFCDSTSRSTQTPQEHQNRNCTPEPREQIRLREPWCPPHTFRTRGLLAWQDHANRVRKGSISLYIRNRHPPRCPDEFSTGFRKVPDRRKSIACLSYLNGGFNWRSNYAVRVCQTTFHLFLMIFSHTPVSVYILLNRFQRFNFPISP